MFIVDRIDKQVTMSSNLVCPYLWTTDPLDPFMSNSQLGYSTGDFQDLQFIVLLVFVAVV